MADACLEAWRAAYKARERLSPPLTHTSRAEEIFGKLIIAERTRPQSCPRPPAIPLAEHGATLSRITGLSAKDVAWGLSQATPQAALHPLRPPPQKETA